MGKNVGMGMDDGGGCGDCCEVELLIISLICWFGLIR